MTLLPRWTIRTWLKLGLLTFVLIYGLSRLENFLLGPQLDFNLKKEGELMVVEGEARRIAVITFNGRQIFTDREGRFQETWLPAPGYNILTLTARDRWGRETKKTQAFIYDQ